MFIVVEGQVKIHDGEREFAVLGESDIVGELAVLDPEPRSADASAVGDCLLFELHAEPLYELMSDHAGIMRDVIQFLCRRVRATTSKG